MSVSAASAVRVAVLGLMVAIAVPAVAHPGLKTASPAANATVAPPASIQLNFSEKLEPRFTGVDLVKSDGTAVPIKAQIGGKDGKTVRATVSGKLAPGQYMVVWHAVAADGHRIKGDYNFTVR